MKFGEIYTYKNAEEANAFVGKKGVFSDSLRETSQTCQKLAMFLSLGR